MNKKSLSALATTIIIISVILIAIILVLVMKFSSKDTPSESTAIDLEIKNVKIDGDDISLDLKRNAGGGELSEIKFIFYDGEDIEIIRKEITIKESEERSFSFILNNLNASNLKEISVSFVYETSSGKKVTSKIIDIHTIKVGSSGNDGNGSDENGDDEESNSSVIRKFSSTIVEVENLIYVILNVTITDDETYYIIEENVPSEWNITDYGGGFLNETKPNNLGWVVHSSAKNIIYTYELQAPPQTGDYTFSGSYMFEGFSQQQDIEGQTVIKVI